MNSGSQPTWNGFFATALLFGVDRMMCCDRRSDRLLISKSNIHHPREVPVYRLRPPPPDQRVIHGAGVHCIPYGGRVHRVLYVGMIRYVAFEAVSRTRVLFNMVIVFSCLLAWCIML